jgi:hypothetical protein
MCDVQCICQTTKLPADQTTKSFTTVYDRANGRKFPQNVAGLGHNTYGQSRLFFTLTVWAGGQTLCELARISEEGNP